MCSPTQYSEAGADGGLISIQYTLMNSAYKTTGINTQVVSGSQTYAISIFLSWLVYVFICTGSVLLWLEV